MKRFVERFSLSLSVAGFPRMAARVFVALLVVDDGRLTAAEIADYLGISRAAVSGAVKFLIHANLVSREREPGHPVDHYRVLDDAWSEATIRKDAWLRSWEDDLARGAEVLPKGSPAWRRLDETREFFAFARGELASLMTRWRARRSAPTATRSRGRGRGT